MSITNARTSNVTGNQREYPLEIPPSAYVAPTAYVRPSDWPTLPTINSTDQKFVGVYAVWNNSSNFITIRATTSTGTFTVDWGDGSSTVTGSSNTTVQYKYDYATVSGSATTRGYKCVIVTVTATTGNLTGIDLTLKYTNTPALSSQYATGWLDIAVGSPNLTTFNIYSTSVTMNYLEQVNFVSKSNSMTSFANLFNQCNNLQNIIALPSNMSTVTNTSSMFAYCVGLQAIPDSLNVTSVTTCTNMFQACANLLYVPELNFPTGTSQSLAALFTGCGKLVRSPKITGNFTSLNGTFQNCYALQEVGQIVTPAGSLTNTNNAFVNCYSLQIAPTLDTSNVTDAGAMFQACRNLISVPSYNWAKATTISSLYQNCLSLRTLPSQNFPLATTAGSPFAGMTSLISIGDISAPNATSTSDWFSGNQSMISTGNISIPKVTNMNNMFLSCSSLTTTNLLNTSNANTTVSMFQSCTSLQTVPLFDTSNVTNMNNMFYACPALTNLPLFNTSKVTSMVTTFYQCTALTNIPAFNLANCTNLQATFQACGSLLSIDCANLANVTFYYATFNNDYMLQNIPSSITTSNNITNVALMFSGCNSLNSIPAINLSNVTTTSNPFTTMPNLAKFSATGMKISVSFSGSKMGKTELEEMMTNLASNNTTQTLTITTNPGADTALSKTSTWTNTSNIITMSNTVGVTTGCIVYGNNISNVVSTTINADNTISTTTLIDNNTMISFNNIQTSNLTANTLYWVSNQANSSGTYSYNLSTSNGGSTLTFTSGTGNINIARVVTAVSTNANITITAYPSGNGTGATATTRVLNTNIATFKGWSVTG